MPGVKGRSGRKKTDRNIYNESLSLIGDNMIEVTQTIIDKAIIAKDVNAATYLQDRYFGKPKQTVDTHNSHEISLNSEQMKALTAKIEAIQRANTIEGEYKLLDSGEPE